MKNRLNFLVLNKYILIFYVQIFLEGLSNTYTISLDRMLEKLYTKLIKKSVMKKKLNSMVHLLKRTVII